MKYKKIFYTCCIVLLSSCATRSQSGTEVASIQLVDRNGINETISNQERIARLEKANFLTSQPYQKVVRTFRPNEEGKIASHVTTYHENSNIWQYLETLGGRARGVYKEWYPNGVLRMKTDVIEGAGDLSPEAQASWVFDNLSMVWSEDGALMAEIPYEKGVLEGLSKYYFPNGVTSKIVPYKNGKVEGEVKLFDKEGKLIGITTYRAGAKNGEAYHLGSEKSPKREEVYKNGRLLNGKYWNYDGSLISEINDGFGVKSIFENGLLKVQQEYRAGASEGEVKHFRSNGDLESQYIVIDQKKEGEEWCYFERKDRSKPLQPMLFITWKDDEIHGPVRTWFENGALESEKDMVHNMKQGRLLAWYEDGSLMMVEEYEKDKLSSGKYFKKGDEIPVSRVSNGKGLATIYDKAGNFLQKIEYQKGSPVE